MLADYLSVDLAARYELHGDRGSDELCVPQGIFPVTRGMNCDLDPGLRRHLSGDSCPSEAISASRSISDK